MEWLSQNWIWLALIVGVMLMLSRRGHGGMMGGCCGGHDMAREGPAGEDKARSADAPPPAAKEATAGQAAERSPTSHKHGRGACG